MTTNEQRKSSDVDSLPPGLNADVAALASLLGVTNPNGVTADSDRELSGDDLAALLSQLDQANGIASGVESRLDGLIGALDELLGGLESDETDEADAATTGSKEEEQVTDKQTLTEHEKQQ